MLYMYIAPGQGQTTPWGQNFYVNRNSLSLCPFGCQFKKILLKSDFLPLFMCFFSNFLWQQKCLFSLPICCKFQNDLFEIWFYTHFLIILYMYIAPRQGQTNPWGQNFDVNRKLLPLRPFVAKNLFEFRFYTHFSCFSTCSYSPRVGADNPLWTKFWCQQKGLVTLPICCKFKKNIFEVWFYTYFCLFYICI